MEKYHRLVQNVTHKLDFLGGMSLALMMVIITVNVILRKLNITFGGAAEYVQFLLAMCIGLSVANCAAKKGHIEISMFVDKMSKGKRIFFEIFTNLITLIFLAASSYFLITYGVGYIRAGTVGMISRVPLYPFTWIVSLGFIMYCFVVVDYAIHIIAGKEYVV